MWSQMGLRRRHYEKASGGKGSQVELLQALKYDIVKVWHLLCQQIWKCQQWLQDWKRSVFIPNPMKSSVKEFSNYPTIALISHSSKVMLKILQARLQQCVNHELPEVQAEFRKGRGTRDQHANVQWIIKKAREFQNIHLLLLHWRMQNLYCVGHDKLGLLICLLRNLYEGQEATVRTGQGTTDWCQIGKGVRQGCKLSPCIFNLYVEYIMRNAGLDEAQGWIKIAGRNINNLRHADDTTLMAESEEKNKDPLDESERGEWKCWLKTQHSEN